MKGVQYLFCLQRLGSKASFASQKFNNKEHGRKALLLDIRVKIYATKLRNYTRDEARLEQSRWKTKLANLYPDLTTP